MFSTIVFFFFFFFFHFLVTKHLFQYGVLASANDPKCPLRQLVLNKIKN